MKEKYTASELIKKVSELERQRSSIADKSDRMSVFNCASTENPEDVRPEYDFDTVLAEVRELNRRIVKYKHALNVFNATTYVGDTGHTIDEVLIILPQLNSMRSKLYEMSMRMKKERVVDRYSSSNIIDYTIANYDIEQAADEYNEVKRMISTYQLELDKVNMTEIIEVET